MNPQAFYAVVLNELRVRTRRLSTLISLLVVVAISWLLVADQSTGHSMLIVDRARSIYNSAALALGTSIFASLLFGLGAFFLVRGRTREDLRCGIGGLLATTPISNAAFLFARWAGAVAYLLVLVAALMATVMIIQLVRGSGPIEPLVYLQMYGFLLLPTIFLAASMAVLCDSYSPLMGKGGDVLYFTFWIAQFSMAPALTESGRTAPGAFAAFDISGLMTTIFRLQELAHTKHISLSSGGTFDAALPPFLLTGFWTGDMMLIRLPTFFLATLPLLAALVLFHRYSPDRVRATHVGKRGSLWGWINRMLRPVTAVTRPLLAIAARLPGIVGQSLADVAITLSANPALLVAMIVIFTLGIVLPAGSLGGLLVAAIACWGVLISDLSVQDHQAATHAMTASVPGGVAQRYARQVLVSLLLGAAITAPILARWFASATVQAMALCSGLVFLSAAATLLGRLTRTGRTFLGLFLFGLYLSTQLGTLRWFDAVGFNAIADATTITSYLAAGVLMTVAGYWVSRNTNA